MKLNNKGWGMAQMLLIMGIMCIALIYVVLNSYKISQLFSMGNNYRSADINSDIPNDNVTIPRSYYRSLERKLTNATAKYIETAYSGEPIVKTIIEYSTLKQEGLITELVDSKDNSICDGYAVVEANSISSYIKCNNYETEGY